MDNNVDEFRRRCMEICQGGFVSMAVSVGHHLKLFDHLPDRPEAVRSAEEVAKAAGCRPRYVQEWLGAMVCAKIVNCDTAGTGFWLPEWRKQLLASNSSEGIAPMIHMQSLLSPMFEKITSCFEPNGPSGTSYSDYDKFHTYLSDITEKAHQAGLLDQFIPSIEGLRSQLDNGIKVMDIGCGHGLPSLLMAKAFPNSSFYGIDICQMAVDFANKKMEQNKLNNLQFLLCCAATGMPDKWTQYFDYVTAFDAIHDQAFPLVVLKEIHRILKPGGLFSMIDIKGESDLNVDKENPFSAIFYTVSLFHCMPVSLNFENGQGLGNMWGRQVAKQMLVNAGFELLSVREMPYSPSNYHYLCRKP